MCAALREARDAPRCRAREENLARLRELRRQARAGTLADREALREAERRSTELADAGARSGTDGAMATGETRVRAGEATFAAPVMIHHYVVAHRYRPPQVFIDAVLGRPGRSGHEGEMR